MLFGMEWKGSRVTQGPRSRRGPARLPLVGHVARWVVHAGAGRRVGKWFIACVNFDIIVSALYACSVCFRLSLSRGDAHDMLPPGPPPTLPFAGGLDASARFQTPADINATATRSVCKQLQHVGCMARETRFPQREQTAAGGRAPLAHTPHSAMHAFQPPRTC